MSKPNGSGASGLCYAHEESGASTQSWWRRTGNNWKVLGKPISGTSSADDVRKHRYAIPDEDIQPLLDALAKARAKSPFKP